MSETTENNHVLQGYDKFGHPLYKVIATPKDKEQWLKLYKMPDRVIPVVFLPGVMGSNLMNPDDNQPVWTVNGAAGMLPWMGRWRRYGTGQSGSDLYSWVKGPIRRGRRP